MKSLRKVPAVARLLQCDAQAVRRIDKLGLFEPRRDSAGHRVYGAEDIEVLRSIRAGLRPGRKPKGAAKGSD
jgi:DNA-binding transcriptional MerR regulator